MLPKPTSVLHILTHLHMCVGCCPWPIYYRSTRPTCTRDSNQMPHWLPVLRPQATRPLPTGQSRVSMRHSQVLDFHIFRRHQRSTCLNTLLKQPQARAKISSHGTLLSKWAAVSSMVSWRGLGSKYAARACMRAGTGLCLKPLPRTGACHSHPSVVVHESPIILLLGDVSW